MIRRLLAQDGLIIAVGLLCGATSVLESWLPVAAVLGLGLLYLSLTRPAVPVALAFVGILLDSRGMMDVKVLGLPITLSKLMVMYAVGTHFVHALMGKSPLMRWSPASGAMAAIIMAMLLSLVNSVDPSLGYMDIAGVLMLILMLHVMYTAVPEVDLPWMLRFMCLVTVSLLTWNILTQRAAGFYVTLDNAWQQRTSGAYGDPNAWSTCLVVVCPMLLAFLARDKHWTAMPLLIGLLAAYPLAILQSMSRAGLLAFALTLPGIAYILRDKKWLIVSAIVAVLVVVPLTVNIESMLLRYQTLVDPTLEADLGHASLREREGLLNAGIKIFTQYPVTGVGVGMFRMFAAYVSAGEVWKIAHNSYVNVAAEQGLPGILTHLYLIWKLVGSAWNGWVKARSDAERTFGLGFLISLGAYGAMAATLNLATFAIAWYMLGVGLLSGRYAGAEIVEDPMERAKAMGQKTSTPSIEAAA